MGKVDFCPYDGKKIEKSNLAYEIIPADSWDWERIKEKTIIGSSVKTYIDEHNQKRAHFYGHVPPENNIMLLANPDKNARSGLCLLKDFVASGGKTSENRKRNYGDFLREMYSSDHLSANYPEKEKHSDEFSPDAPLKLHYEYENDIDTFLDENKDPVFYAMPCCPYCHSRLPQGWVDADDFLGISCFTSSPSENISLFQSLYQDRGKTFRSMLLPNSSKLTIKPAYFDNGILFLKAQCGSFQNRKTMLVGIYDRLSDQGKNTKKLMLNQICADFYFFDRRRNQYSLSDKIAGTSQFQACKMLTMEEQARFQKQNAGKLIKAEQLLKKKEISSDQGCSSGKFSDYYEIRTEELQDLYEKNPMKRVRFIGMISNCDPQSQKELSTDRIRQYDLLDGKDPEDIREDYYGGTFWHSMDGIKDMADMIISLIMERMKEKGWN